MAKIGRETDWSRGWRRERGEREGERGSGNETEVRRERNRESDWLGRGK